MRSTRMDRLFVTLLYASVCWCSGHAQMRTFVREYTYAAGEADSKLTARAFALEVVKRQLLEEVGVYIRSTFENTDTEKGVGDSLSFESLTKRQTTAITAGITETKVLDEQWNGVQYYIKAEISLDPADVNRKVQGIMKAENDLAAMELSRRKAEEAMAEVARLKQELQAAKGGGDRRLVGKQLEKEAKLVTASDWFERGYNAAAEGRLRDAIECYDRAVDLDSTNVEAYNNRGAAKFLLTEYRGATADYDTALGLKPGYAEVYYNRGLAKAAMRDYRGAGLDYDKAIELKKGYALAYYSRGVLKSTLRDYDGAIADQTKAIESKTGFARAYYDRGLAKYELHDADGAIADYGKAIQLDAGGGMYYLARGMARQTMGNIQGAQEDFRKAKSLGYSVPKEWMGNGPAGDSQ
jgi:tetratricopeptide (TPR) repeat protein